MGETAEILAKEGNISREQQEEFSIKSHEKALKAWKENHFENEVVPIDMYGESTIKQDEGPREPNLEKIKSLDPAFLERVLLPQQLLALYLLVQPQYC